MHDHDADDGRDDLVTSVYVATHPRATEARAPRTRHYAPGLRPKLLDAIARHACEGPARPGPQAGAPPMRESRPARPAPCPPTRLDMPAAAGTTRAPRPVVASTLGPPHAPGSDTYRLPRPRWLASLPHLLMLAMLATATLLAVDMVTETRHTPARSAAENTRQQAGNPAPKRPKSPSAPAASKDHEGPPTAATPQGTRPAGEIDRSAVLREAAEHLVRGDYPEALSRYRRLAEAEPQTPVYASVARILADRVAAQGARDAH